MSTPAPGALLREPLVARRTTDGSAVPLVAHPQWSDRFPWLVQGTTARGQDTPFDLGLAGVQPVATALGRWWALRDALCVRATVLARQVHGRRILTHDTVPDGLHLAGHADGHRTRTPDLLLTVTVADCVPVFLVVADPPAIVLLHAGWRGIAAGILEHGIAAACDLARCAPGALHIHCGPSICGRCYEVGPEVHAALGLPVPGAPEPVDLRAHLARRAVAAGVPEDAVSRSEWCTRCDHVHFFSHRGGDAGRQIGVLGIRSAGGA